MHFALRYRVVSIAGVLATCIAANVRGNSIAAGDVIVYQTRNDVTGPANAAPVTILDINPQTPALVQSFPLLNLSSPLFSTTIDPIANVTLSNGGKEVSFVGWTNKGTAVQLGTTQGIPRGVGAIDFNGTYSQPSTYNPTTLTTPDQPHAAFSQDGANWYFGDTSGMYYNGATTPLTNSDSTLSIKGFGPVTYALHTLPTPILDSGPGSQATVISTVSPSIPSPGITSISYSPVVSITGAHDFALVSTINQSPNVLYVTTNNGISKFGLVSGSWVSEGSILLSGATAITAKFVQGTGVQLYVTDDVGVPSEVVGKLDEITDSAAQNAMVNASSPTLLYTAPNLDALEGVSLAPTPEPGAAALLATALAGLLVRRRK